MKKIVFITDSLEDPRIQKRKLLMEANSFSVSIYGFMRGNLRNQSGNVPFKVIGDIGEQPYYKRLHTLYKGIRSVVKQYVGDKDVIYYLFGLQVAIIFKQLCKREYIYEEADLVHTYLNNNILRNWFEKKDISIISGSALSIFTSEGFINYHFSQYTPSKCIVVPNKLKPEIQSLKKVTKNHPYDPENIQFGFVGGVRFESTILFIEHVVKTYPQHVFHIYGIVDTKYDNRVKELSYYDNFKYHGPFKNPYDLPNIYSDIDFVLSTYDIKYENVRYAEPNKLYESIYFRTPIIVSEKTFLADRVNELGVGIAVDALQSSEIDKLINSLTIKKYNDLIIALNSIDQSTAVDSFMDLNTILN